MNHLKRRDFLRLAARSPLLLSATRVLGPSLGGATAALYQAHAHAQGISIVSPRLVNPAVREPGDTFTVEVRGDRDLDPGGWSAKLQNELRVTWPCQVQDVTYDSINADQERGWKLRVQVPASIAPELMALLITHSSSTSTASQAVSIVPDLEAPFYLLHITDEHVFREKASDNPDSEDRRCGYRTTDLVRWGAPVVNLINPRIVINGGDQTHRFYNKGTCENPMGVDIYRCYLQAKRFYRVPSMMILGNHDVNEDGDPSGQWADWERLAGRRYYSIGMGSFRIFAHDYTDPQAKQWMTEHYNAYWNRSDVRGRLFVQHYTDWNAFHLPSDKPATAMLIGHIHDNRLVDRWPFPILMSIAAHRYVRSTYLGFKRDEGGTWRTDAANHWNGGSYLELVGDNGKPNVAVTYDTPNDGRARSNRATVRNDLGQSFADGRVRFIMDQGSYQVHGGDVIDSYAIRDGSGTSKTAVLVRTTLDANATGTLSISQDSRSTHTLPANAARDNLANDNTAQPTALDEAGVSVDSANGEMRLTQGPSSDDAGLYDDDTVNEPKPSTYLPLIGQAN